MNYPPFNDGFFMKDKGVISSVAWRAWFKNLTEFINTVGGGGAISPSGSVVTETSFGQASSPGVAASFSRGDHTHGTPAWLAHAASHAGIGADPVDHDGLLNFASNEHIDHSTVSITGAGILAGQGGNLTASRVFTLNDADIDHDQLLNFIADEHIDWTNATDDFLTTGDATILSDASSLILGAGSDMSIKYNGIAGIIETDLIAASDLQIDCGTAKTIELIEPVWDDCVTPLGPNNWNGAANNPTLTKLFDDGAGSQGVYAYVFSNGDEVLITIQMPHKWKEGTTIYPHIHFMCTSDVDPSDNFGIEFEYTWVDVDEDFSVNTTLSTIDIPTGVNTDDMHQAAHVTAAGISGAGHTISSVLLCRLKRVAATADDYAGGVAILSFDVHYEIDTIGSRQEFIK